jgi:hypothetical protein
MVRNLIGSSMKRQHRPKRIIVPHLKVRPGTRRRQNLCKRSFVPINPPPWLSLRHVVRDLHNPKYPATADGFLF